MNWLVGATVIRKSNNCFLVGENIEITSWELSQLVDREVRHN
jgi:hypothetical protein